MTRIRLLQDLAGVIQRGPRISALHAGRLGVRHLDLLQPFRLAIGVGTGLEPRAAGRIHRDDDPILRGPVDLLGAPIADIDLRHGEGFLRVAWLHHD